MTTVYIGIDPGMSGGFAVAVDNGAWIVDDCPVIETSTKTRTDKKTGKKITTVKKEASPTLMAELLRNYIGGVSTGDGRVVVYIEKVSAMPGQGVTSMFSFGRNFGQWEGVASALRFEVYYVTPQRWQKVMLADMPKGKETARMQALRLFPYLAERLKFKKNHGRADAVLIGEYGRRTAP